MIIPELVKVWALTVFLASLFTIGYYSYIAVKRRFDSIYNEKQLFIKRAIHGTVYILLLILADEGVKVKISSEDYGSGLVFLIRLFLVSVGIPIFLDIALSIYKMVRKGGG